MLNLMLTRRCNCRCDYCFARSTMQAPDAGMDMEWKIFERALDLVRAVEGAEIRLLGGEPTLHPAFASMLETALRAGLRVLVFSNGFIPDAALAAIARAPLERCHLVLNLAAGLDQTREARGLLPEPKARSSLLDLPTAPRRLLRRRLSVPSVGPTQDPCAGMSRSTVKQREGMRGKGILNGMSKEEAYLRSTVRLLGQSSTIDRRIPLADIQSVELDDGR